MNFELITQTKEGIEIGLTINGLNNFGLLLLCIVALVIAFMFFKFKSLICSNYLLKLLKLYVYNPLILKYIL
ncbi:hypothetical protein DMN26_13680 [Clostridium perfringens]